MAEKKEASIWWTIFKMIFAFVLLGAVMNGYFLAGAKSLSGKAAGGVHALLSADMLKDGTASKK